MLVQFLPLSIFKLCCSTVTYVTLGLKRRMVANLLDDAEDIYNFRRLPAKTFSDAEGRKHLETARLWHFHAGRPK